MSLPELLACLALGAIVCPAFAANPPVVFEDDFSGDRLSPSWQLVAGQWSVQDGVLTNRPGRRAQVAVGDEDWDDYTVQLRFRTIQPGRKPWSVARVMFRYRDPRHYYYALLHTDGKLELGKDQGGEHVPGLAIAADVADPLAYNTLRAQVREEQIKLWVNDILQIEYTDPDPIPAGKVALDAFQNSQVAFDSLAISGDTLARRIAHMRKKAAQILERAEYVSSETGNIAIFHDPSAPTGNSAPADPNDIARMLQQAGYAVTLLGAEAIANRAVLSKDNFDVLVLPYGAAFPQIAIDSFTRFLAQRGSFLSMGGYFADNLYSAQPDQRQQNLLTNPQFTESLTGWHLNDRDRPGVTAETDHNTAKTDPPSAMLTVQGDVDADFYSLSQTVSNSRYDTVMADVWLRTEDVSAGHGAYLAIDFCREDGTRITWAQSQPRTGTTDWSRCQIMEDLPPGTTRMELKLILHGHGKAWFDDARLVLASSGMRSLNTRHGDIRGPGNSLRVSPRQIGVFAPNYPLDNVTELRAANSQNIVPQSFHLNGWFAGFSSSGLFIGNGNPVKAVTHARPIHLIDAFDNVGRRRGAAGTLVRNYRGQYAGSDWAVFGINNRNLFSPTTPGSGKILTNTIRTMMDKVFIAETGARYACYRPGETIELRALIANYENHDITVRVRFTVLARRDSAQKVHETTVTHTLPARSQNVLTTSWSPSNTDGDFFIVRSQLVADDINAQPMEGAFVIWRDEVVKNAPRIHVTNAHLSRGDDSVFMCGTGESGYPYYAHTEGPLVWNRQFQLMRDMGLRYYRCMHFFTCYPDDSPLRTLDDLPADQLRRLDALVYLAHKHDLMFLFVCNVGLQLARNNPDELAGRRKALQLLADRYRDCAGFLFNMDHQEFIRTGNPAADRAFRAFLQGKYESYAQLASAWGLNEGGAFEDISFDDRAARNKPWNHPHALDVADFLLTYRKAWRRNGANATHAGNPRAIFDQDFSLYWWPDFSWPEPQTMTTLNMVSAHYYGTPQGFPLQTKRSDMQVLGKPNGLTEYGILTHPAWQGHRDARLTKDAADEFFMMATHYCFGLGGTMMSNWNWKEMKECIFPWSIAYHDLVPKAHLRAYRNAAILLNGIRPRYVPPEVFIVVPSAHLATNRCHLVDNAVRNAISRLMAANVRFGLIGERYLERLPAAAKALYYPVPYCPPDPTVARLFHFVETGGCLYFSGDITFDPTTRQRNRAEHLRKLAGVGFAERNYDLSRADSDRETAAIRVEPHEAEILIDGEHGPRLLYNKIGDGHVLFAAEPIELTTGEFQLSRESAASVLAAEGERNTSHHRGATTAYSLLLELAHADLLPVEPRTPKVHTFKINTVSGGAAYVFYNAGADSQQVTLTHADRTVALQLAPGRPGLVHLDHDGRVQAVESQGRASIDGHMLWSGQGHFIFRSLDGEDLSHDAKELLVAAVGTGHATFNSTDMPDPLIQYGCFRAGGWQPLDQHRPRPEAPVTVKANESLRSVLALVTPRSRADAAARKAEQLL